MIGFGFMDNFVLIIAGDYIDSTLGVTLGISTMCAAALGNIISDLCGVPAGNYIEAMADKVACLILCAPYWLSCFILPQKFKIPRPNLSPAQHIMPVVRHAKHAGIGIGLTIGCILGMCPLLFMEADNSVKQKAKKRLNNAVRGSTINRL
jgi:hypothetical protein